MFEYACGFVYCISAKLMKDMEPFFRFESKADSTVYKLVCLIYLSCCTSKVYET